MHVINYLNSLVHSLSTPHLQLPIYTGEWEQQPAGQSQNRGGRRHRDEETARSRDRRHHRGQQQQQ